MAFRVRCGDVVRDRGQWREVTGVRLEPYVTGGVLVVLMFREQPGCRVRASDAVEVLRAGEGVPADGGGGTSPRRSCERCGAVREGVGAE
jgi:hypothetical protein